MRVINVAKEFTKFPSGRYKKNGDTSGQAFRERFLIPQVQKKEATKIQLDGTIGYGSSFLEEAFGGLVRELKMAPAEIRQHLQLESADSLLIEEINSYIDEAGDAIKKG